MAAVIVAIMTAAGCDDDRPKVRSSTVLLGDPTLPVLDPRRWTIGPIIRKSLGPLVRNKNYSVGMPLQPNTVDGWSFEFPMLPGAVHYITTFARPLELGKSITITFEIRGAGQLLAVQPQPKPGLLRLHIQRAGDNWSGKGDFQHFRFWSKPIKLLPGTHTLTVPLEFSKWTGVYGRKNAAQFGKTVSNAMAVGFSFGASFAGHGVYRTSSKPVRFILKNFAVR